jgi:hypothetical protein
VHESLLFQKVTFLHLVLRKFIFFACPQGIHGGFQNVMKMPLPLADTLNLLSLQVEHYRSYAVGLFVGRCMARGHKQYG